MKKDNKKARGDISEDRAVKEILSKRCDNLSTIFDRAASAGRCPTGSGVSENCCRNCSMGPCIVTEKEAGICGATPGTVTAWNFARHVAAGASAGSGYAKEMAVLLGLVAEDKAPGFKIRDESKLKGFSSSIGIESGDKDIKEIAREVSEKVLSYSCRKSEASSMINAAPEKRRELWRLNDALPGDADSEIVKVMAGTGVGADQDPEHIMDQAVRCALSDGWGSSLMGITLRDILFGTPAAVRAKANLGMLKGDEVNLVVYGNEPALSEIILKFSEDNELLEYAKGRGAGGINVAGLCCAGNESLDGKGIHVIGNFLSQEAAVITGAVELMVSGNQCVMQSVAGLAEGYHTKLVTTWPGAKIAGALHIEFNYSNGEEFAKKIIRMAIDNYPKRKKDILIPDVSSDYVAGFSPEYIQHMLGGKFRGSLRPLNDAIIDGRIQGIAAIMGCNNVMHCHDKYYNYLAGELIRRDYLVVATGCAAIAMAKSGLMAPEAKKYAGDGLKSICEAVGMPPVLHMGSHEDNSNILAALSAMVQEGGLGEDISDLPVAAVAPEWMSEREISTGTCAAASGVYTIFSGEPIPVESSREVKDIMTSGWQKKYKGQLVYIKDVTEVLKRILNVTREKRSALKIDVKKERVLLDMEARRTIKDV
ncbi:MAG: anaerobic carbon-monoxide dehydrogenase catalytic subunit [Actinomycetota bacterium]|nr:anaerobic carbon-monoxide dehydrogenase catalytic subunit [Actinomycetota bacterium]